MARTTKSRPEPESAAAATATPGGSASRQPTKKRGGRLRERIRLLEGEIAEFQANEDARLYGLTPEVEAAVARAIADGNGRRLFRLVRPLHPADFADLIERNSKEVRRTLVTGVGKYFDPDVLVELDETVRDEVIDYLDTDILARSVASLPVDDAVEVLGELDDVEKERVLRTFPDNDRALVEEGLAYPEDTAGRLMQREMISVPKLWTVGQTIDFLRTFTTYSEFHDLIVIDDEGKPLGKLALSRLLCCKRPILVADIMQNRFHRVLVHMDQEDAAMLFRKYALVSAPVVDDDGKLVGIITIDDIVAVIDEEAEEDLMRLGGVTEDDLHDGLVATTRSRFSWLAVNLVTAIVASLVIGLFETTLEKLVAIAILMPIVASMGGNAGTQALTVAVRALAMRELTMTNAAKFVFKETTVASINGIAVALLAGVVIWIWFGDYGIALILAAAMIVNLVVAGFFGAMIPIGMQRLKLDPAVASTVFLTTVTDVVGFMTFLGLAAFFLL